tara:strand:- start:402 stop:3224 length:2823 start_codon:yes stop_codon:yes gene_type:complete
MWENGLSREAAHSEFEREENAAWAKLTPEQQKQHLDDTAYGVGKNSYHRMSDNLLEWFIRDGEKQLLELEEDLARVLDEGPVDPHGIWRDGEHATYLRGRIADREATLVDEKREWKRREADRLAGGQFVGRTGMRSIRVPAGRRGRGGVRTRQREAATDRAAMPRGTGTRSRKHTRVHQQPGVDRFKDADGNLWTNLGTEENAQDIKEAIAEAAHFQLNRLMWGLAHNDLDKNAEPQRSGFIHRAEGKPIAAKGRVADRAHALEISRIGYNESNGVAKDYFDKEVRGAPHNADKDKEWFKNYVFDDSDIADVESWVEKSRYTRDPKTQQKIKMQLQDIKTLRNMIEQYNETGGPGGGGDLDSFAFLEHLNPASRGKIFERASGPNRDRIPGSKGVNKDTKVKIGGVPAAWKGPTTLHAPKDVREARTSKLGGGRRRSMHEWRKEMATRIMAPNEARRKRRRARLAALGGPFAPSASAPDPTKLTWEERRAILKRKWRRATGRGNPGFEKRHAAIMEQRELHPLRRSTDRLVKGAGAKLEFPEYEEADRGLPVVTPGVTSVLAWLAGRARELEAGDRKKTKKVGDVTKGDTTFGRDPTVTDHMIDDMYRNLAMMRQAQVVGDQGLAEALLDPNVLVVMRGMGENPQGRQFARHYIDAPGRFIGNRTMMAHGLGDDWARPLDPASATRGSLYGHYGTGVLGLIDPKSFRIIDMAKMIDIRDEHQAIEKSIAKVVTESTEGSRIADVVRKTPPDDLAKLIRHRLNADQADGRMRLPNRAGQRKRVYPQTGRRSFGGYKKTGSTYEMDRETTPWEETEIGSIIDQLLTQLEDIPTMNLDEIRIEKTNKGIVPTDDNLRQDIQEEIADALEMMHRLQAYKEIDTFMYLPIIGADGIHRNGGVVKVANRSALTVHETPMDGDTIKALVDKLAPGFLIDQARREQNG